MCMYSLFSIKQLHKHKRTVCVRVYVYIYIIYIYTHIYIYAAQGTFISSRNASVPGHPLH